jgi:hypothetical protein
MIGASLVAISVFWGLVTFWVFRRFTDHAALRKVRKRMYAHLLEIRLFSDEPALVWSAQKALLVDNLRFLALVSKPVLIMALPFALLYGQLDSIYGWGPLEVGHSTTVTVAGDAQFKLLAPAGISVETPPVRVLAEHQISWRIRALEPIHGILRVTRAGGGELSRSIVAGERTLSFYRRRESALEVDYPKASVGIFGIILPWLAWLLIVSTVSAALLATLPGRGNGEFRHS